MSEQKNGYNSTDFIYLRSITGFLITQIIMFVYSYASKNILDYTTENAWHTSGKKKELSN